MFVNEKKNAIELTKKEAAAAAKFGTPEYKALQEVRRDYPGFKVVTITRKSTAKKESCNDYAFERVYNHVVENGLINNTDPQIGDIVLVTETPTFLDFNYFQQLFGENGAVKMVNEQNKKSLDKTIEEIKGSVPKGAQMPPLIKQQIEAVKAKVNGAEPERKDMVKTIEAIRNTLPYNRFVMTTNMLIPLDDDNFRDNPNIVAFKYGGNMSILGYVTNIVTTGDTPARNNDFAPLYDAVNQIMLQIFKNQDKIYIVHPVALFY